MRPEIVDWLKIPIQGGRVKFALYKMWADTWHDVGDRQVPSPIVLELREPDAPAIDITIEVIDHVPRMVDFRVWRYGDGREVRKKDIDLNLEDLIERAVAIASARVVDDGVSWAPLGFPQQEQEIELRRAMKTVQQARGRSQRQMTPERMQHVAKVYLAQESGGIDAVATSYNVHRATAARWVAKARQAGHIPPKVAEA